MYMRALADYLNQKGEAVFLIQTKNGMLIVAKIRAYNYESKHDKLLLKLSKPFLVHQTRTPQGAVGIGLIPYMTFGKPNGVEEVVFNADSIEAITVLPKDDEMYSHYISATSGIAIATKQPQNQQQNDAKIINLLKKE